MRILYHNAIIDDTMEQKSDRSAPISIAAALNESRGELMGISAILIVIFHLFLPAMADIPIVGTVEDFFLMRGFWAVDVFFLLSGAGLVRSIRSNSLGVFYYRRFKRIFLPFFLVALFYLLKDEWTFFTFVKAVTGIGFILGDIHLFLWFVPAIAICYLLYPLYFHFYARSKHPVRFTVIAAAVVIIAEIILIQFGFIFHTLLMFRIPTLLLGTLLADQKDNKAFLLDKKVIIICLIAMPAGILLISGLFPSLIMYTYLMSGLIGVPFAILLSAVNTKTGKEMFLRKAMRAVGKISFETYCIHPFFFNAVVVVLINTYFPRYFSSSPDLLINIIALVSSILAGYVLYLINKGFCMLLDRVTRKGKKAEIR